MSGNIFSLIRTKYNTLSKSQKTVADYILNNQDKVMLNTLNDIAFACGVSETTVLRFLRKIGFTSYQLFRINLTQEISKNTSEAVYEDLTFQDSTEQIMEKIIQSTTSSIRDSKEIIDINSINLVVDHICKAQKVLVIGVGASASIATDLYHKLLKLNINVVCSNDPHMINILSINLTAEDLLIVISHSGESREVLEAVTLVSEQKCKVCAITSYAKSSLANRADYVICSSSLETMFRSDAMTSRIIQIVIIDIIYVCIIVKEGEGILPQIHKSRLAVAKNKV
ncbi:MAG: MurR/RpiR family transcriptional regulator [Lachnospiraceae bacterium]